MSVRVHYFKTHPEPFEAVAVETKGHEIRKDDRHVRPRPGDTVVLREWHPHGAACGCLECRGPNNERLSGGGDYTGRELRCRVTYVSEPGTWGLPSDLYVMSVRVEQ